ncbi:MAG TPA: histidine kinase [Spirosoma sp.]|nr:histidine kinase [Spirosoma sp.]
MQYTQRDNQIALGVLPVYYLLFNYLLFGPIYLQRLDVFVPATLSIVLLWTPVYFLHALPALYFRRQFPAVRQTWLRLSLAMLAHMLLSSLAIFAFFYGYDWFDFPHYTFSVTRLQTALIVSVGGNLIINVIHESVYTFERWSQTLTETERLRRANLQSQLDGLKSQVNPHFLFNSLNSLSSLIDVDSERAEQFIEELASVYRYLLQTNEGELTTLGRELQFIQSYYHLQRTRYGNGLTMQVNVDDEYQTMMLPPLTLQLLVENAIKHNVVAADQPLHIMIETIPNNEGDTKGRVPSLRVSNNLQRRPSRVLSNGVGLANIATKYQLLGQKSMHIDEQDGQFVVTLPLLVNHEAVRIS